MNPSQTVLSERDPARWKVLYAVVIATIAVVIDAATMSLIAPAVAKDLSASAVTIGLITSAAGLTMSAFILGGGTLGDIYGRKRFLSLGLIGLILTSLLAMFSTSTGVLTLARALAGVTSALISPLAMAIIMVTFDGEERPKALGVFTAITGIFGGLGTLIISFLNQQFGWRSTFGLSLVFAVIAFLMVSRFVKESKAGISKHVDWVGILLTAAGLFGLVYGIGQAGAQGITSPAVIVPAGAGVLILVILVMYSRRAKDPALQLDLFMNKFFAVGVFLAWLAQLAFTGAFFQVTVYQQALQGLLPLQASLISLPLTLAVFVFAILSGRWAGKYTQRLLIVGGLAAIFIGMAVLAFWLSPTAGFWTYLAPLILIGGGFSIANTSRISLVLSSAPPERAGVASATNNAATKLGAAMGIATMSGLFQGIAAKAYTSDLAQSGLGTAEIERSIEVLSAWLKSNAGDVSSEFGITVHQLEGLITNYQNAYTTGVTQILWIAGALTAVAALLAWLTLNKNKS